MILIGMYDSSYTRRVAIAMALYGIEFEHRAWSVGRDFHRIREYNPLGRAPTLVLDDGEVLTESTMILDYLDDRVGPGRALLPATGRARRDAQRLVALATGAIDKAILIALERIFRPVEQHSEAWLSRCRVQVEGALGELERACASRAGAPWLVGDAMTHADIAVACYVTHLREAIPLDLAPWPALRAHVDRCEALEVFRKHYSPFSAPTVQATPA
ncbi:glutathione S-transferase family protein [Luteimonas composti]|uniref:Glutathione S-transferase family protein n=1 Tax=Luteimonas composti TaxID=398257 RepID=A0ABT6MNH8_9GAMM|nr:glutathione S-transferase family protein [Luteimonas composti]MDH7452152.1 glutathione S-transferase family protein [Luteimonas composti]